MLIVRGREFKTGVKEQDLCHMLWSYTAGQEHAPLEPYRKSCKEADEGVCRTHTVNEEDIRAAGNRFTFLGGKRGLFG